LCNYVRWYPGGSLNQTFNPEAFGLYKSYLSEYEDNIRTIYAYFEYYHNNLYLEMVGSF